MNLNTAVLLCDRFLATVSDGDLLDRLTLLIGSQTRVDTGAMFREVVADEARQALEVYDQSIFADTSLRIFPEYDQLGLSSVMGDDLRARLTLLAEETLPDDEIKVLLSKISDDRDTAQDLISEIAKLASVADYFGVEKQDIFVKDAIAVFQIPETTDKMANHNPESMNQFIDHMQSFQAVVDFCETVAGNEGVANIRMFSGIQPSVVADLSTKASECLQALVSQARKIELAVGEITDARDKLANIRVKKEILKLLKEESKRIDRFEGAQSKAFIKSLPSTIDEEKARAVVRDVRTLMRAGARIDCIEGSDDGAINTHLTGEPDTLSMLTPEEVASDEKIDDFDAEKGISQPIEHEYDAFGLEGVSQRSVPIYNDEGTFHKKNTGRSSTWSDAVVDDDEVLVDERAASKDVVRSIWASISKR